MPSRKPRLTPLEVQAASYLAASARIVSFSRRSISSVSGGAFALGLGLVEPGDELHQFHGDGTDAKKNKKVAEAVIVQILLERSNLCSSAIINRTNVLVKKNRTKFLYFSKIAEYWLTERERWGKIKAEI